MTFHAHVLTIIRDNKAVTPRRLMLDTRTSLNRVENTLAELRELGLVSERNGQWKNVR